MTFRTRSYQYVNSNCMFHAVNTDFLRKTVTILPLEKFTVNVEKIMQETDKNCLATSVLVEVDYAYRPS